MWGKLSSSLFAFLSGFFLPSVALDIKQPARVLGATTAPLVGKSIELWRRWESSGSKQLFFILTIVGPISCRLFMNLCIFAFCIFCFCIVIVTIGCFCSVCLCMRACQCRRHLPHVSFMSSWSMKINGSAPHCTAWSKYQNQRALMLRWQSCCWRRGLATQIQQEFQDFPLDFEEGMREYYSLLVFNFCLFWFFGQKNRLDLIASIHFLYSLSSTLLSFLLKISIVWF